MNTSLQIISSIYPLRLIVVLMTLFSTLSISLYSQRVEVFPFDYNSSYDDLVTSVSKNGTQMYCTIDDNGKQRIAVLDFTNNRWQSPEYLNSTMNSGRNTGGATLTPDGQYMVFASIDHSVNSNGRTDLYSARKVNGSWTDIQNLGSIVNSTFWDSQPSLSSDGNTLYFASDRSGNMDIYVSKRQANGIWGRAEAMSTINTKADECTPCIASDNSTLYIASNRQGTVGGFDIYVSRQKNGSFSRLENLGEPINSTADEYFYHALPNSTTAYFSSDRAGGAGGFDIYRAVPNPQMPGAVVTMRGIVHNAVTNAPIGAKIEITDLKTRQKVAVMKSDDETGEYFATLTAGRSYSVTANHPDYIFYSERIDVPLDEKGRNIEKDIDLTPIGTSAQTRLLVYFDTDQAILKEDSYADLDKSIEFLKEHEDVRVRFEGHTDDVGDDTYNMNLSKRRAQAVMEYILKGGIPKSRLETEGFGESKPKLRGTGEEIRAQNRRVEMKII